MALKKVLSFLYSMGVAVDRRRRKAIKLEVPVISVGNIAVGGRAKTPMIIYLVRGLKSRGFTPVVLTRGYGRSSSDSVHLNSQSPQDSVTALNCGDEPIEIFLQTDASVVIGADRVGGARTFLNQFNGDKTKLVFVLDDGFQHWSLDRDFDLVLVTPEDLEGSLLPLGNLRELPEALARADFIVKLGSDVVKKSEFTGRLAAQSRVAILTTRALGSVDKSLDYGFSFCDRIELADHASPKLVERALLRARSSDILVGGKEAAKFLSLSGLRELQQKGSLEFKIKSRSFVFHWVGLQLQFATGIEDKLWNSIERVLP